MDSRRNAGDSHRDWGGGGGGLQTLAVADVADGGGTAGEGDGALQGP